jgi:hypothetical protein
MTQKQTILRTLLLLAMLTTSGIASAQSGPTPSAACGTMVRSSSLPRDSVPDLAGIWDFRIETGNAISTGTMALGHMDSAYAGALTPDATNTVAIRKLTLMTDSVHMSVASREGDVLFDGRLTGNNDTLCGIVTYHGGARFPMIAIHRRRVRSG